MDGPSCFDIEFCGLQRIHQYHSNRISYFKVSYDIWLSGLGEGPFPSLLLWLLLCYVRRVWVKSSTSGILSRLLEHGLLPGFLSCTFRQGKVCCRALQPCSDMTCNRGSPPHSQEKQAYQEHRAAQISQVRIPRHMKLLIYAIDSSHVFLTFCQARHNANIHAIPEGLSMWAPAKQIGCNLGWEETDNVWSSSLSGDSCVCAPSPRAKRVYTMCCRHKSMTFCPHFKLRFNKKNLTDMAVTLPRSHDDFISSFWCEPADALVQKQRPFSACSSPKSLETHN